MGQAVECTCGQRNDLAVFSFGEAKLCLACGRPLSPPDRSYLEEAFVPEIPPGILEEETTGPGEPVPLLTGFESPSELQASGIAPAPAPQMQPRLWTHGVRESAAIDVLDVCTRCQRPFRGDWDRQETASGIQCHLCATKADTNYQPPSKSARRAFERAEPPKKIPVSEAVDQAARAERARKKKGLTVLAITGTLTVLFVVLLPVEHWIAAFFSTDISRAESLPAGWLWFVRGMNFCVGLLGQGALLYVALAMMDLLYEDRRENIVQVAYLALVFTLLNGVVGFFVSLFGAFGPIGAIIGMLAFLACLVIQLMMISSKFPLRMEGGVAFIMAWSLCALLIGPCVKMVGLFLGGIVAAILL